MAIRTRDLIAQIVYFHSPILLPIIASLFKRIRAKWKYLAYGLAFQIVATLGIYLFTWYSKWAGYEDWFFGWYLYYPVNIASILVYVIIILYIFRTTRAQSSF